MPTPADIPDVKAFRAWQDQSRLIEQLQITFVVGPPKCGTTWAMDTLRAHPEAVIGGESHAATKLNQLLIAALRQYMGEMNQPAAAPITRDSRNWIEPIDEYALLRQMTDRILLGYLRKHPTANGTVRVLADKTPGHARQIPMLAALYPWAKFVCCVRDVRDAAVSAWHYFTLIGQQQFFGGATTIDKAAEAYAVNHWAELLRHARHAGAQLGPGRYTEFSYESAKADPHQAARALYEFLNLTADEDTVRACVERASFRNKTGGREAGTEDKSFFRKGIVGDWQNHFDDGTASRIVALAEQRLATPVAA